MDVTVLDSGLCTEEIPAPGSMVIFGASGDLAKRKLVPALYGLHLKKLLPKGFYFIGCGRTELSDEAFRQRLSEFLPQEDEVKVFLRKSTYVQGSYDGDGLYEKIAQVFHECPSCKDHKSRTFYLSTPPKLHGMIIDGLAKAGLTGKKDGVTARVVVEKPFGRDLASAKKLECDLRRHLDEDQIYRIDHYLGKETVQNILMFRFANLVFEPVWNRNHISKVEITVAESLGVEKRAGYYDTSGVLRDMFQNHMLQLLALVAMEAPTSFDADRVRDERVRLLRAIHPLPLCCLPSWMVRGQYKEGELDGKAVRAYRDEEGVSSESETETYAALKLFVDNWRWKGVPFFLRSGKRLSRKLSEIAITFKQVPHSMFSPFVPERFLKPNVLVMTIQPHEGLSLTIQAKHPGPKLCISPLKMEFSYDSVFGTNPPNAYERLLLDTMLGDQSLFVRHDEMEITWSFITPLLETIAEGKNAPSLKFYKSGSDGPEAANELVRSTGHEWRPIAKAKK